MTTITNLIANPCFGTNLTGWNEFGGGTLARVTSQTYNGTHAMQCTAAGGNARPSYGVTIPASTHLLTFWVWHNLGAPRTFVPVYGASAGPSTPVPPQTWTAVSMPVTGTGAAASCQIRLPDSVAGEVFVVGHAQVTAGMTVYGVVPELDASGGLMPGSTWTSTPHASTSTRAFPDAITLPILRLSSPHIGPLRAGKA